MGHLINSGREYHLLQQRIDNNVIGAPDSPVFFKILRLLFSPEEANLARQIPNRPTSIDALSHKMGIPQKKLEDKLHKMVQRGVLVDLELKGKRYFMLPPVVIGFFEFIFMRARYDLPMTELSNLFEKYLNDDDRFIHSVFQGQTQIGRSMVREESLLEGCHSEILDWERVSYILKTASSIGISLCSCRHKASHLDKTCSKPQRTCFSINHSAEVMIRNEFAQPITLNEALHIIEICKEAGLMQIGDNVRRNVTYICNCCSCCCNMIKAIKTFNIRNAIITSNWIMEVNLSKCQGCGKCSEICPIGAIDIYPDRRYNNNCKQAAVNDSLCLGCGVCYSACKFGSITIKPRSQKVLPPETIFDRIVSMAIERGKLVNLLFDDPEKLSHRAFGRIFKVIEKSSPFKATMAIKPLHSIFLKTIVKGVKIRLGKIIS